MVDLIYSAALIANDTLAIIALLVRDGYLTIFVAVKLKYDKINRDQAVK